MMVEKCWSRVTPILRRAVGALSEEENDMKDKKRWLVRFPPNGRV